MTPINRGFEIMIPKKKEPLTKPLFHYKIKFKLLGRTFSFDIDIQGENNGQTTNTST